MRKRTIDRQIKYLQQNRELRSSFFEGKACLMCGETDTEVFECDHLGDKKASVSSMLGRYSKAKIAEEIAKCQILCANCHSIKTQADVNSFRHQFVLYENFKGTKASIDRKKWYVINHLLKNPCVQCNLVDIRCLEFDHLDRAKKYKNVSYIMHHHTLEALQTEMEKCRVLCRNCHCRHTNTQRLEDKNSTLESNAQNLHAEIESVIHPTQTSAPPLIDNPIHSDQ